MTQSVATIQRLFAYLYTDRSAVATIMDSRVLNIPPLSDHRPTVVEAIICE